MMSRYIEDSSAQSRSELAFNAAAPRVGISPSDVMTASFALPYICLLEPEITDLLYTSKDSFEFWNPPGKNPNAPYPNLHNLDNYGGTHLAVENANSTGDVEASVTIERRGGKRMTVTLSGASPYVLTERTKILKKYYTVVSALYFTVSSTTD